MPSAVKDHGPSVFFSACSGDSESRISLSMDLRASSWLARMNLPFSIEKIQHTRRNPVSGIRIPHAGAGLKSLTPGRVTPPGANAAFNETSASIDRASVSSISSCCCRGGWSALPWEQPSCAPCALPSYVLPCCLILVVFATVQVPLIPQKIFCRPARSNHSAAHVTSMLSAIAIETKVKAASNARFPSAILGSWPAILPLNRLP